MSSRSWFCSRCGLCGTFHRSVLQIKCTFSPPSCYSIYKYSLVSSPSLLFSHSCSYSHFRYCRSRSCDSLFSIGSKCVRERERHVCCEREHVHAIVGGVYCVVCRLSSLLDAKYSFEAERWALSGEWNRLAADYGGVSSRLNCFPPPLPSTPGEGIGCRERLSHSD